jgi:hypothetical protein
VEISAIGAKLSRAVFFTEHRRLLGSKQGRIIFLYLKARKESVKTDAENGARREQMPSLLYYRLFAASKTVHNNDEGMSEVRTQFDEKEL